MCLCVSVQEEPPTLKWRFFSVQQALGQFSRKCRHRRLGLFLAITICFSKVETWFSGGSLFPASLVCACQQNFSDGTLTALSAWRRYFRIGHESVLQMSQCSFTVRPLVVCVPSNFRVQIHGFVSVNGRRCPGNKALRKPLSLGIENTSIIGKS